MCSHPFSSSVHVKNVGLVLEGLKKITKDLEGTRKTFPVVKVNDILEHLKISSLQGL